MPFKPPIGGPLDLPTTVSYDVQASPDWWRNNSADDAFAAAEIIVAGYAGAINQTVFASRQQRQIMNMQQQRVARQLPGLFIEVTCSSGMETLRLTVQPENAPGGTTGNSVQQGGVFDVKVPFVGFPVPGMGSVGGDTYPDMLLCNGPAWFFDPVFSPSDSGLTSKQDTTTGLWVCANALTTPDQASGTTSLPKILLHSEPPGTGSLIQLSNIDEAYWCKGTGGSAILTQPLAGKQYWEVEIVAIPRGRVPAGIDIQVPTPAAPTLMQVPLPNVDYLPQIGANVSTVFIASSNDTSTTAPTFHLEWPTLLDSWGTPIIGVCPGYYLPADMLPGDPTKAAKKFQDYTRVVGLDPYIDPAGPKNLLARSIALVSTAATSALKQTPRSGYFPGMWEQSFMTTIGNQSELSAGWADYKSRMASYDPRTAYAKPTLGPATIGGVGWGQVCYDSSVFTPAPGTPAAVPASGTVYADTPFPQVGSVTITLLGSGSPTTASLVGPPSAGVAQPDGSISPLTYWPEPGASPPYFQTLQVYDGGVPPAYPNPSYFAIYYVGDSGASSTAFRYTSGFFAPLDDPFSTVKVPISDLFGSSVTGAISNYTQCFQDIIQDGYHSPVIIGRVDLIPGLAISETSYSFTLILTPYGDGSQSPLDGTMATQWMTLSGSRSAPGGNMGPTGLYSGVDLGELAVGDVVMVATDTATGYIWFGKNGVWYGPDPSGGSTVQLTSADGPAIGTKWTAIMDGFPKSATPVKPPPGNTDPTQAQPQYFPAVGWRIGAMEAKIHYGQGMKFPTPGGFKLYGQSTSQL
jgi:hypothetical protein